VYVPVKLVVSGDALATAGNIAASMPLFRWGFAGYLVEALCNVALTLLFYELLKPAGQALALLGAFFGLVGISVFAVAELFYVAPLLLLQGGDYLKEFSPDQLNTMVLLSLKFYGLAGGVLMLFGGAGSVCFGVLIWRSRYLPKLLGALLTIGGVGFVLRNFLLVLAPPLASEAWLLPMSLAMLALAAWFLARGVDAPRWQERVGARAAP
jgi:hypothetical protein